MLVAPPTPLPPKEFCFDDSTVELLVNSLSMGKKPEDDPEILSTKDVKGISDDGDVVTLVATVAIDDDENDDVIGVCVAVATVTTIGSSGRV
jgi:hypothetical protein